MKRFLKAAAFAGLLVATGAQAADLSGPASMGGGYKDDVAYSWWNAGDIFVRVRGEAVIPQVSSDVHGLTATTAAIPEADITYFLTKHIAVETICCVTEHDLDVSGKKVGDTTMFPPTVLLQYHFDGAALGMPALKPYVGAGVNYTVFFDESTGLKINDAWGAAVQAGLDYHLTGNWFANVDFKKFWLDTSFTLNGAHHNADLDPIIAGAGIGYRFGTGYTPLK